jgi:rRNA-processing protein FCF1
VRDRIVSATAGLRRLADGPLSAVVFFDSTHADESYRNFGVTVRFVGDADDAIVEAAAGAEIDCIAISTDRQVRARAEQHGALTLWGTAFSDWIKRR